MNNGLQQDDVIKGLLELIERFDDCKPNACMNPETYDKCGEVVNFLIERGCKIIKTDIVETDTVILLPSMVEMREYPKKTYRFYPYQKFIEEEGDNNERK